jgi:hypothetical protein
MGPGFRRDENGALAVISELMTHQRESWGGARWPAQEAVGLAGRPRAKPGAHRAGRVKAAAAPRAGARSACLDAA